MKAKKHLGQHFLHSEKALLQIVDAVNPTKNDIVLEIGPGQGALTERLVSFAKKVVAVEKDNDMVLLLNEKFKKEIENQSLEIIQSDILEFNTETLRPYRDHNYKVVGNIPYYITGAIIEKFLSASYQPQTMTLLIQKEVAERIIARDKKESVLSIAVKVYGRPRIIDTVKAGSFNPPPKVDSSIIIVEGISRDFFKDIDEILFFEVLKSLFGKKRKQIGGSLGEYLKDKKIAKDILEKIGVDIKTRPEDLTLPTWRKLVAALVEVKNSVQ